MNKINIFFLISIFNINLFSYSPELLRAINKFLEIMQTDLDNYQESDEKNCLLQNMISVSNNNVGTKLLNKNHHNLLFNQSNGRSFYKYYDYNIEIFKYSLRRKITDTKDLTFKIWKYEIYENNQFYKTIFWTEKGLCKPETNIIIPIIPVYIKELKFLQEFMDKQTAVEIFGDY